MKRVVIESPLAGNVERNQFYARLCVLDCLRRGEAPYASHLLYAHPDVLDDSVPTERKLGMEAGFAWGAQAELCVVYLDLGVSRGMAAGADRARAALVSVEHRHLPDDLLARFRARYPEEVG